MKPVRLLHKNLNILSRKTVIQGKMPYFLTKCKKNFIKNAKDTKGKGP